MENSLDVAYTETYNCFPVYVPYFLDHKMH